MTDCAHGHKLTPLNTYVEPSGVVRCRECRWQTKQRYLRKRFRQRPWASGKCLKGLHAWIPANIVTDRDGAARCRACRRELQHRRYHNGIKIPCLARGCSRIVIRHEAGVTYLCGQHRQDPPAWIAAAGLRIVGTEVLAA